MNKKTINDIVNMAYEEEPLATIVVNNKTKDITLSRHGMPEPVLGNLEEIYKNNKSKSEKTAKVIVELVRKFEKEWEEKFSNKKNL